MGFAPPPCLEMCITVARRQWLAALISDVDLSGSLFFLRRCLRPSGRKCSHILLLSSFEFADSIAALADSLIADVEQQQQQQQQQQLPTVDDSAMQQPRRRDSSSHSSSGNSNGHDSSAYTEHIRTSSYALLQQAASR